MKEVKQSTASNEELPQEKSRGRIVLIVVLIIVFLGLLCTLGGYFFARDVFYNFLEDRGKTEIYEDSESISDFTVEEDEEYPSIHDEVVDEGLISDQFPQDISLPGGRVTSSSFTNGYSVDVNLATSSSLNDVYEWFEEEFAETEWIITSKSRDNNHASIKFDNGKQRYEEDEYRRGSITISDWGEYWNYREISITEYYY